jgi:ribosomal RNA-processing protein 36
VAEREEIEIRLHKARSAYERYQREQREKKVLQEVKKEERAKQAEGKGEWHMKRGACDFLGNQTALTLSRQPTRRICCSRPGSRRSSRRAGSARSKRRSRRSKRRLPARRRRAGHLRAGREVLEVAGVAMAVIRSEGGLVRCERKLVSPAETCICL